MSMFNDITCVVVVRVIGAHRACLVVVLASYPQPPPILGARVYCG